MSLPSCRDFLPRLKGYSSSVTELKLNFSLKESEDSKERHAPLSVDSQKAQPERVLLEEAGWWSKGLELDFLHARPKEDGSFYQLSLVTLTTSDPLKMI